jgi:hypothetical protein
LSACVDQSSQQRRTLTQKLLNSKKKTGKDLSELAAAVPLQLRKSDAIEVGRLLQDELLSN